MSNNFSLLSLHSSNDVHPRAWIGVRGNNLLRVLSDLREKALKARGKDLKHFCKELSLIVRYRQDSIQRVLCGETPFYPIPIILELLKTVKKKEKFEKVVEANIQYLKVNSASAKPIRAIHKLTPTIAKIIGAFVADGSLSIQTIISAPRKEFLDVVKKQLDTTKIHYTSGQAPTRKQFYIAIQINKTNIRRTETLKLPPFLTKQTHYNIELTDEYKDNVETFNRWVFQEFNIHPTSFGRRKRAWRTIFSNKILARYFMRFFDFEPGTKTYTVQESKVIQRSPLSIRRGFARGVLMFDGCITKRRNIMFTTVSRKLYNSIKQIWERDGIKFSEHRNSRGENNLSTTANNSKNNLLKYFEKNTQKRNLLNWLSGNKVSSIPIIKRGYKISLDKLIKTMRGVKKCDARFLKDRFGSTHTTIRYYLKILQRRQYIKLTNKPFGVTEYIGREAAVSLQKSFHFFIFRRIREKFSKDQNFAKILNVHKATFSAWRLRKNRIPIYILKEICTIMDLDYKKTLAEVRVTDREIAEII